MSKRIAWRACIECGVEFAPLPKHRVCSPECLERRRKRQTRESDLRVRPRQPLEMRTCVWCGESFEAISRGVRTRVACSERHYKRWYNASKAARCNHPGGCPRPSNTDGLCRMHHVRKMKTGDVGPVNAEKGINAPDAVSPGYVTGDGYVVCCVREAGVTRKMLEHRHVMEQKLGRRLRPEENVHHINGVKHDNRPENLELWSTSQPSGQRVDDKIAWAVEFLREYGYDVLKPKPHGLVGRVIYQSDVA